MNGMHIEKYSWISNLYAYVWKVSDDIKIILKKS
jgi:hypothetical protein